MDIWVIICKRCGSDKTEGQIVKHQMNIQNRVLYAIFEDLIALTYYFLKQLKRLKIGAQC